MGHQSRAEDRRKPCNREQIVSKAAAANTSRENQHPPGLPTRPVIFFDGVCGLCDHFVDFVIARDGKRRFLFAPLQGITAADLLNVPDDATFDSVVLWDDGKMFQKSTAVVRILWKLGGVWRALGAILWLVPWPLRNVGYRMVARWRYRLFGRKEVCRMPKPDERERFLD